MSGSIRAERLAAWIGGFLGGLARILEVESGVEDMLPNLGPMELMLLMGLGVLLFGKRLPEVGRSLGRGIVEFKKGLNGVGDEFDISSSNRSSSSYGSSHRTEESRGQRLGLLGRLRAEVRAARHRVELSPPSPAAPGVEYPAPVAADGVSGRRRPAGSVSRAPADAPERSAT